MVAKKKQYKQKKQMTTEEAFNLVYDLAVENLLDEADADTPELKRIRREQQEALDIVHDFIINNIHK